MNHGFEKIGHKWQKYGLLGIWRDQSGIFYIDENSSMGIYYFGLFGEINGEMCGLCFFREMPEDMRGLTPLWLAGCSSRSA